ncbi:MAG: type III pantothenate kinase [Clostridia bacterium]
MDRIAAAVGANMLCPNTPLLVIDMGTAITYDFVNSSNEVLYTLIIYSISSSLLLNILPSSSYSF